MASPTGNASKTTQQDSEIAINSSAFCLPAAPGRSSTLPSLKPTISKTKASVSAYIKVITNFRVLVKSDFSIALNLAPVDISAIWSATRKCGFPA